ncbi:helix-turn-helix domain-containing protein [Lachnospira pectinoschiza]|uniref:Helix-turn-helix domain-containing protein n=1 Tax=Lachnospira pectinoschiza TaxID=28052 RepID=A0A1G9Z3R5_9FIRM|nr:helix-turn-helix domain-containing protein [Lachnospira pectinoschiza]SDN15847.1 Helix-turn-helix domain-containing protein [Lachnospira pectinoschiza]
MSTTSNMIQPYFDLDTSAFKVTTTTLYTPSRMMIYELDAKRPSSLNLRVVPSPYIDWIIGYNDDNENATFYCIGLQSEYKEIKLKAYKHFFGVRFDEKGAYFGKGADAESYPVLLKDTVSDYAPEKDSFEKILIDNLKSSQSSKERVKAFTNYLSKSKTFVPISPIVNDIVDDINASKGTLPILSLADKYGYSSRHITRIFFLTYGLTPKEYAKLIRFQCVVKEMIKYPNLEIGKIINGYGYSDQAHFHRDFKKMMQNTPRAFELLCREKEGK